MKYIKKFNELYDSDDIKSANEIEGMTTGFEDQVRDIKSLTNEQQRLWNKVVYSTPQLAICHEKNDAYYYMRSDEENDMVYFCFDGEACMFEIGFRKDGDLYSVNIYYADYVDEENSYDDTYTDLPWTEVENKIGNDLLDTLESIGFTEVKSYKTKETINKSINSN